MLKQKQKLGKRTVLLVAADCLIVTVIYFATVFLHWNFKMDLALAMRLCLRIPFVILCYLGCNVLFKVYHTLWRYAGLYDILQFSLSAIFATCGTWVFDFIGMKICRYLQSGGHDVPLYFNVLPFSVYVDSCLLIMVICLQLRLFYSSARLL